MKTMNKLISTSILLLFCSISLSTQYSSDNFQLLQSGFLGGNPNEAEPPASGNFEIIVSVVGAIVGDEMNSNGYIFYPGFLFPEHAVSVFDVTPVSLSTIVDSDDTDTDILTVSNMGEADLIYTAHIEYSGRNRFELLNENWFSANFSTNDWIFQPEQGNWQINVFDGNPSPSAEFNYSPIHTNYEYSLVSAELDGTTSTTVSFQYDIFFDVFSATGAEYLTVEVYDGFSWNLVAEYDNSVNIPWTTEGPFDISEYAAGNMFNVRFRAHGDDTYNINWWLLDNITIEGTDGPTWLTLDGATTTTDTVAVSADEILVGYDAAGLSSGDYQADIVFTHNAAGSPDTVDVTMTVIATQPDPPANVFVEIVDNGDSVRLTWSDEGYNYKVYSSDDPHATFPGTSWILEATVTGDHVELGIPIENKKFYVVTADNTPITSNTKYKSSSIKKKR